MRYEKKFVREQAARTDSLNRAVCVILLLAEGGRLLGYALSAWLEGRLLDPGYLRFFLVAALCAALFWILNLRIKRTVPRYVLQFSALAAALLWSCFYSVFMVRRGYTGSPLPQVLLLTSIGIRSPGPAHLGVNIVVWALYMGLLGLDGVGPPAYARELVDSGIYLLISCLMITATYRFQYDSYRMEKETQRVRAAQLDIMAGQVEQAQQTAKKVMELRHDLRHYAWTVRQGLERGDLDAVTAVTDRFVERLDQAQAREDVRSYTGEPSCDAILSRFGNWARSKGISYQVELTLPRSMEPQDLCLILMNALDNAAHAVNTQPGGTPRYIQVFSCTARGQYFLEITNTCTPDSVAFQEDGLPVSPNAGSGHGYGTRSIVSTLDRYRAHCRFREDGGVFHFQFLLPEKGT